MNDSTHPAGHLLQAYFDGELDSSLVAEVKSHCEECRECQTELADLAQIGQLLAAAPTPELPRTVWHRVRPGQSREPRFKPIFGITAGAVGIALGLLLGPLQFSVEKAESASTNTEAMDLWAGGTTSSLLAVFQTSQN